MLKGFRDFILRGNVLDLAVAVVIGGAFGNIVKALVEGIITPLIGALGGQANFARFSFTIGNTKFMIGEFLNAIISFLIVATVIYFVVVLPTNSLIKKLKGGDKATVNEKICPECLSAVPLKATRCKHCTAKIK